MRVLYVSPQPLSGAPEDEAFAALLHEAGRDGRLLEMCPPGGRCTRPSGHGGLAHEVSSSLGALPTMQQPQSFAELDEARLDLYLEALDEGLQRAGGRFRPDLVHVNYLWLGAAMARSICPHIPIVASCHPIDFEVAERCPGLLRRVVPPVREVDHVLTACGADARLAGALYGIRSDRLGIIGAGVDALAFRPPEAAASVAFAAAVEAHALALPVRPALRVVLVGRGDEALPLGALNCLAAHCAPGGGVLGVVLSGAAVPGGDEDGELYRVRASGATLRADLFRGSHLVVPWGDVAFLRQTALEALACGCRVMLPDAPEFAAWPDDELAAEEGIHRYHGESDGLGRALAEELGKAKQPLPGTDGQRDAIALRVASRASWEAVYRAHGEVYRDVLGV